MNSLQKITDVLKVSSFKVIDAEVSDFGTCDFSLEKGSTFIKMTIPEDVVNQWVDNQITLDQCRCESIQGEYFTEDNIWDHIKPSEMVEECKDAWEVDQDYMDDFYDAIGELLTGKI